MRLIVYSHFFLLRYRTEALEAAKQRSFFLFGETHTHFEIQTNPTFRFKSHGDRSLHGYWGPSAQVLRVLGESRHFVGCLGGGAGRGAATVRRGETGGQDWVGRARCNWRRRVASGRVVRANTQTNTKGRTNTTQLKTRTNAKTGQTMRLRPSR